MLLFVIPHILAGVAVMFQTMKTACTHENLTISATSFNVKRTIEFKPKYRDSVLNADKAEIEHPKLDKIFCKQISGRTDDLTGAEVRRMLFPLNIR